MSVFDALILGIIQGLTEFLPVSSSGHLKLGQYFLGLQNLDQYVMFDLICHLGTLFAILRVFSREIYRILRHDQSRLLLLVIGTLPLFPLALIIKPLHQIFDIPSALGFAFIFTAIMLWTGEKLGQHSPSPSTRPKTWKDASIIGLFQAIAVVPGISRSGSTISIARIIGWDAMDAARFSFILAIPAILGGVTLESLELALGKVPVGNVSLLCYSVGFLSSFVVGWLALHGLLQVLQRGGLKWFSVYCFCLGVGWLAYLQF